jgi:formylglycine-generating enzyme required for sulfatase activity
MGSPKDEKDRYKNEDQHEETIEKDFYIGRYEVTQEQYEAIIGANEVSRFKGKKLPVDSLSWDGAKEFCKKLSKKTGKQFRLPLEKEWEYACRAGTKTPFHFDDELNGTLANCDGNYPYGTVVTGKSLGKTTEVGSYPANPWGLHDMHGNVFEWCEDLYSSEGTSRVLRGGSWGSDPVRCRASYRGGLVPSTRLGSIGFRLCFPLD